MHPTSRNEHFVIKTKIYSANSVISTDFESYFVVKTELIFIIKSKTFLKPTILKKAAEHCSAHLQFYGFLHANSSNFYGFENYFVKTELIFII